ncbi:hypothetical protein Q9R08_04845 [Microbacterium sp. QXD-8]|uniref:RiboL-PSP-HEPN domain-containing protein n=1 Tax=Microbacterium psychrotolerans TaxID=3068321 RepID=A0ABU0YY86_9MICO|nr:hypothetical protein [Microbacterium sp. QXD-8]MDQ7877299.1 hypothetical protein [Microbacterium sp. QXD-8]
MPSLASLAEFQRLHALPVKDSAVEAPALALHSLREAAASAPTDYQDYLDEAVRCYEGGMYRAAVLMVWSACIQHLFSVIDGHRGGIKAMEKANHARYGTSNAYRRIRKTDDLLYLKESSVLQIAEDAGLINRNARALLDERLTLRNLCGHPTRYRPGRDETVIFIESLVLNIIGGTMVNWQGDAATAAPRSA